MEGQGELDAAVLFYKKAIQVEPEFADAHFNLAMVLEALGNAGAGPGSLAALSGTGPREQVGGFHQAAAGGDLTARIALCGGTWHPLRGQGLADFYASGAEPKDEAILT